MDLLSFISLFILYTGGFLVVNNILILNTRRFRSTANRYLSINLIIALYMLLFHAFEDFIINNPLTFNIFDFLAYLLYPACPPIFYGIYHYLIKQQKLSKRDFGLMLGFMLGSQLLFITGGLFHLGGIHESFFYQSARLYPIFNALLIPYFFTYFIAGTLMTVKNRGSAPKNRIAVVLIINSMMTISQMISIHRFFMVSGLLLLGTIAFYDLILAKDPNFAGDKDDLSKGSRYLKNIDVNKYIRALESALSRDEVILDNELDRDKLAQVVNLNYHQLSELVNRKYNLTVSGLINKHRIGKALEMIEKDPDRKISDIAWSCGFNSLNTFYHHFKLTTGEKPGSFIARKKVFS